jgi:flagellar protein FliS
MKQQKRGLNSYRSTRVDTAPTEQILVMIFQAAVLRQENAIKALQDGDVAEAHTLLHETRILFGEVLAGLDDDVFPELCARLRRLYGWCMRELIAAEREQDPDKIRGVMRVTQSLLEGWTEAARRLGEGAA